MLISTTRRYFSGIKPARRIKPRPLRLSILLTALLGLGAGQAFADERPRKIFAHHMGSENVATGAARWHTMNGHNELGDPETSNGGDYRNYPLAPYGLDLNLKESADLQIRRAMRIGIDGFAVNAWCGGETARQFLDSLFAAAEEEDYPFEITISLDPNCLPDSSNHGKWGPQFQAHVDAIHYLLDNHGESPNLARREGKPLIFGYASVWPGLQYALREFGGSYEWDDHELRGTEEGWRAIGRGYQELQNEAGTPLYLHFDMTSFFHGIHWEEKREYANAAAIIAEYVDAVGDFLPRHMVSTDAASAELLRTAAREVVSEGSEWGHPVFLQYENNRNNRTFPVKGTETLQRLWEEAREHSTLLQYTTWNDYQETSNLSPGYNTRYAYYDLTGYFIEWWKTGKEPVPENDRVYIFSRKYPGNAPMFPFGNFIYQEGALEVLTILPEPATIRLIGRDQEWEAPAGLFHRQFPVTAGDVAVEVIRNGQQVLRLESPEPITDRPFRQDNGINAISTEFMKHWEMDFGDAPPLLYSEYGDIDGDGLPNWFEMYWYGKYNDLSTATSANANFTPSQATCTNLQHYTGQTNPHLPTPDGHSCPEIAFPPTEEDPAEPAEPPLETTIEAWKKLHFTPEEQERQEISGDLVSPTPGGVPNLLAYALGIHPGASDSAQLPQVGEKMLDGERYLTLTYTRIKGATDLRYIVQVSEDAKNWYTHDQNSVVTAVTPDGDRQIETLFTQDTAPMDSTSQRFIRLRIEKLETK